MTFITPDRLIRDFELAGLHGRSWIAEAGLILVDRITRETLQKAITEIAETDFFDRLTPDS